MPAQHAGYLRCPTMPKTNKCSAQNIKRSRWLLVQALALSAAVTSTQYKPGQESCGSFIKRNFSYYFSEM